MLKLLIVIFLVFISISYGIVISQYEVFPYEILKQSKILIDKNFSNESFNTEWYESNVESLIRINSTGDITEKRSFLINYIWKNSTLSSDTTLTFKENYVDKKYDDFKNLASIEKLTIKMPYEVNSISYLFHSKNTNGNLIIYHQGHKGDFFNGKDSIQIFLNEGYDVLAFSMPLLGMNNQPVVNTNFGKLKLSTHNHFELIETSNFSPLVFFLEPIMISLNFLDEKYNYNSYSMIGISGGGWTTTLYSAIDERISNSFSVAGSFPIYLRSEPKNLGDYEQTVPELYSIANYLELYLMSSYGDNRKHIQFFNKNDPCCFSGNSFISYEESIKNKILELQNGNFQIYLDESHNDHKISKYVIDKILEQLSIE